MVLVLGLCTYVSLLYGLSPVLLPPGSRVSFCLQPANFNDLSELPVLIHILSSLHNRA